jgi:hypothetical protein
LTIANSAATKNPFRETKNKVIKISMIIVNRYSC